MNSKLVILNGFVFLEFILKLPNKNNLMNSQETYDIGKKRKRLPPGYYGNQESSTPLPPTKRVAVEEPTCDHFHHNTCSRSELIEELEWYKGLYFDILIDRERDYFPSMSEESEEISEEISESIEIVSISK